VFSFFASNEGTVKFFKAVNCTEKFLGGPKSLLDNFHTDETESFLASTGWLCPDIDYMNIQNYYGSSLASFSSYMYNLVYCDDAASSLGYFDPNCETDHAISNSVME
jgi:hypothetical protein